MQASDGEEKTESQASDGNSNRGGMKRQASDGEADQESGM